MDTTRLRRTFRYIADEDDPSDEPEVLDEQEQDTLIQTLAEQNQRRNEQFRQLLLSLPALAMIPFLLACTSPSASSSSSSLMLALLGLTSLAATAYLLYRQPAAITGIAVLDTWSGAAAASSTDNRRKPSPLSLPASSPLDRHLPLLNAGLCAVLLLSLFLPRPASSPSSTPDGKASYLILGSLPALVYGVVLIAKMTMAGVDPERELSRLRYEYKGA